jgi:hypothetical protein
LSLSHNGLSLDEFPLARSSKGIDILDEEEDDDDMLLLLLLLLEEEESVANRI